MEGDHTKTIPLHSFVDILFFQVRTDDNLKETEVKEMKNPDPTRSWLMRLIEFLTRGKESPYEKIDRKMKKGKK